eukprot:TRINITY_DN2652_c0_g1_i3.p1 TRINITY_DN2652_c0_g1~~TRINITY_DN2652_c0_g1_i3.p1  ORF type:complete len:665 (-),score=131.50 TRINITY_DN2652_c0_g1_i3:145-2139(-)
MMKGSVLVLVLLLALGLNQYCFAQIEGPGWNFWNDPYYNGLLVGSDDTTTTAFQFDWVFTSSSTINGSIHSNSVAIDSEGNYIVVGTFKSELFPNTHFYSDHEDLDSSFKQFSNSSFLTSQNHTSFIYKMDPQGNILWYKQFFNTQPNSRSYCYDVATTSKNDIIVTGALIGEISIDGTRTRGNEVTPVTYIAGFSTVGKLQWVNHFSTPSINLCSSLATAVEVGNDIVYAFGYFANRFVYQRRTVSSPHVTYFLLKLSAQNGDYIWSTVGQGDPGTTSIYASEVVVDQDGNPTFIGTFTGRIKLPTYYLESPNSKLSVYVIKVDHSGKYMSSIFVGGPDSALCTHRHYLKVSPNTNNYYISGCFNGTINFYNSSNFMKQNNGTLPVIWNITNTGNLQNAFSTYMAIYDNYGGVVWVNQIGGSQAVYGGAMALKLSTNSSYGGIANESVILMGYFTNSVKFYWVEGAGNSTVINCSTVNQTNAGYLVEYNIDGNVDWITTFDGMISIGDIVVVQNNLQDMYVLGTGAFRGLSAWGNYSIKHSTDVMYLFRMTMDLYYPSDTRSEFYRDGFFWLFAAVSAAAFVVVNWIAVVVVVSVLRRKVREWQLKRELAKEKRASRSKFASSYVSLQKDAAGARTRTDDVEEEKEQEILAKFRKKRREKIQQ